MKHSLRGGCTGSDQIAYRGRKRSEDDVECISILPMCLYFYANPQGFEGNAPVRIGMQGNPVVVLSPPRNIIRPRTHWPWE